MDQPTLGRGKLTEFDDWIGFAVTVHEFVGRSQFEGVRHKFSAPTSSPALVLSPPKNWARPLPSWTHTFCLCLCAGQDAR